MDQLRQVSLEPAQRLGRKISLYLPQILVRVPGKSGDVTARDDHVVFGGVFSRVAALSHLANQDLRLFPAVEYRRPTVETDHGAAHPAQDAHRPNPLEG